MNSTLFKNAHLVTPHQILRGNLFVRDGVIVDLLPGEINIGQVDAEFTVDLAGKHILPGVIDDQVHFRDPGLTHKEDLSSASLACAAGGVTSFLEMPNTKPPAVTVGGVHSKQSIASEKSLVNYGFYIGATPDNLNELIAADCDDSIPGIKIFIGSSTGNLLVDNQDALESIFANTKSRICAHCEDETTVRRNQERLAGTSNVADHSNIRDVEAAIIATKRAIDLSTRHEHPFHVLHVSTAAEIPLIAAAPSWVTAEVCPHHLFFNVDDYERLGTRIQMNPSIKSASDNDALWQALCDGTIDLIATDHAPHTLEEKAAPYPQSPSGLPAIENSLALMLNAVHQNRCDLLSVAKWMSTKPAEVWNIRGKGKIAPGYDADLVVVDLNESRTILDQNQHTKTKWSPWHGVSLTGWPVETYLMGKRIWSKDNGFETQNRPLDRQLRFDKA